MAAPCADVKFLSFPPGAKEPVLCVDGFQFADESITKHYFLSHFHSDHTVGLRSSFAEGTIYCSPITGRLLRQFTGVDHSRIVSLPLGETTEVAGVDVTLVDANHCPGAVVFIFHHKASGHTAIHTGDVRAAYPVQEAVQRELKKQNLSVVHEIFLDTTYASPRWDFPPQPEVLEVLAEMCSAEAKENPRTLFVVGSYQIGKERAAAAIARAVGSSVWTSSRRFQMLEACDWASERVDSSDKEGKLLFTTDSIGCSVRLDTMMGITHERLLSTLEHTKGGYEAICAFRPTGWTFSKSWRKCRAWQENNGRTKIFSMPYSEHSSFSELRAFVTAVRPQKMVPTVNIERSQQMVDMFAPGMDLSQDRERLDWYLFGASRKAKSDADSETGYVNVLKLSGLSDSCSSTSASSHETFMPGHPFRRRSTESNTSSKALSSIEDETPSAFSVVDLIDDVAMESPAAVVQSSQVATTSEVRGTDRLEDLSCVDLAAQRRQLEYYEKLTRSREAGATKQQRQQSGWPSSKLPPGKKGEHSASASKAAPEKRAKSGDSAPKGGAAKKRRQDNEAVDDGSANNYEKRNGRFIPKPSQQVRERMDRAYHHRMYLLSVQASRGGEAAPQSATLDVLGSTGNVYTVSIGSPKQSCTCTDFGKHPTRVCKHILFVMLRVCRLHRSDPRVWQSALTMSEAGPLLAALPSREALASQGDGVLAHSEVLRGFDLARGPSNEAPQRPIEDDPDCPICFEPMVSASQQASSSSAVDWCRSCGHNAHKECIQKWHAAKGATCPLCRGSWVGQASAASAGDGSSPAPLNLASFSSMPMPSLQELYPETHQWIGSPNRRPTASQASSRSPAASPRVAQSVASSPQTEGSRRGRGGGRGRGGRRQASTPTRADRNESMQVAPESLVVASPQTGCDVSSAASSGLAVADGEVERGSEHVDTASELMPAPAASAGDPPTAGGVAGTEGETHAMATPRSQQSTAEVKRWPSGFCSRGSVKDTREVDEDLVMDLE
mmetsp:Transcript_20072/g.46767  ORF Transcript_20072/g.46767 Transcript_20072/m.46767 type:complete len:1008 (-) Transcript_20072:4-3027(-)